MLLLDLQWLRGLRRETHAEAADFRRAKAIAEILAFETLQKFGVVDPEVQAVARAAVFRDSVVSDKKFESHRLVHTKGAQAMGLELFIGDYRIPEYGSTRD